jgi:hypothetical protein
MSGLISRAGAAGAAARPAASARDGFRRIAIALYINVSTSLIEDDLFGNLLVSCPDHAATAATGATHRSKTVA